MECAKTRSNLKRKTTEGENEKTGSDAFIFNLKDASFIRGNLKLNQAFLCETEDRYPDYRMERFGKYCDIKKALPHLSPIGLLDALKSRVSGPLNVFELLKKSYEVNNFKKVINATRDRVHDATELPKFSKKFNLSYCSPWLSKAEPQSVTNSKADPEKSNIYANVTATHHVDDDFVVVEENGDFGQLGYSSSAVLVKATVGFPPICDDEIWTVGWIQGLTKDLSKYYYDKNKRFVV